MLSLPNVSKVTGLLFSSVLKFWVICDSGMKNRRDNEDKSSLT